MQENLLAFAAEHFEAIALVLTALLGLIGFLVTYLTSIERRRAEARLKQLSDQLEYLYGPLYALIEANSAAWVAFRKSFRQDQYLFDEANPFTPEEAELWKAWAENVFIPSNLRIREIIERNAHLYIDGTMPEVFKRAIAHIESSKIVLPAIAHGNLKLLQHFDGWPDDLNGFVAESYAALVEEYSRQIGRTRGKRFTKRIAQRVPATQA